MNNITASTTKMKTGLVLFMASLLLVIGVVLTQGDAYAHNYQPSPTPSPTPSPSMSPTPKPSPTPSPTPSPSPSPSPSPTPTPTPVASPSPSATPTTIVINNHQEQKQEQHNNQTVNINTGTTAKVAGVKTPAKTPDTGVSVLGMASMFGAGPLGFALMRYGRGRIGSNREESLSEQALNLLNKRTGGES